jgi:MSHA biogenesis protein MshL
VLPSRLEARVFQINYLNIERSGASSTFVSAGTLQEGPNAPLDAGATRDNPSGNTDNEGGRGQRTVVGTQINTIFPETSFWQELASAVTAIVGDGQGRSVVVNPQSGVVVVRAIPTELREVEAYLQASQLIAQRQVILEAKILEVELADGFQAGINWAGVFSEFTVGHTGGGKVFEGESGRSDLQGAAFDLIPGVTNIAGVPASAFGGVFSLALNGGDFSAFLELLQTQGQCAGAVESADFDDEQPEGDHQGRDRRVLRHRRVDDDDHRHRDDDHTEHRTDAVLLRYCARRDAADQSRW